MRNKQERSRIAWIVVAAALLVLGVLLAAFLATAKGSGRNTITLPDGTITSVPQLEEPDAQQAFLQVNAKNVQQTLKALQRPEAYHQALTATLYWEGGSGVKTVEQWRSGRLVRAQITEAGRRRNVLSDGTDAWVWYDGDTEAARFPLDEGRALEDLIGVASFETVMDLEANRIEEAGFDPAQEDGTVPCIWLRTQPDEASGVQAYWVDVTTQLLWKSEISRDGSVTYTLLQTAFERLDAGDATLASLFALPDGQVLTAE